MNWPKCEKVPKMTSSWDRICRRPRAEVFWFQVTFNEVLFVLKASKMSRIEGYRVSILQDRVRVYGNLSLSADYIKKTLRRVNSLKTYSKNLHWNFFSMISNFAKLVFPFLKLNFWVKFSLGYLSVNARDTLKDLLDEGNRESF